MDLRGYGLPFHTGYTSYSPERSAGIQPDLRDPYGHERDYSLCNLSLSEDQAPERMPRWTSSPKKHTSRGSDRDTGDKYRESEKLLASPRNQNPGIDIALRNLDHEAGASLRVFRAFVQCFEREIESLQDWAEDYTLDTVWRNKIRNICRDRGEREKFRAAASRIASCREAVKEAVKNAKALREVWDDKFKLERQVRTAKKALLNSEWVINLAERAASERLACKQLVIELGEMRCLLEPSKHPWIYAISRQAVTGRARNPSERPRAQTDEPET
ncbi:203cb86d-28ea-4531-9ddc-6e77ffb4f0e6 [Thermothielavioides terrestris]|nr:203cb86d-28ea-4531-9ddc-6e77ffb4f0e6 [Thermothielavioides terrestris]